MDQESFSSAKINFNPFTLYQEVATIGVYMLQLVLPATTTLQVKYIFETVFWKSILLGKKKKITVPLSPEEVSVNKTVEVQLTHNIFQLAFQDFPATLKPSLYFSANVSELASFCLRYSTFKR